MKRYIPKLFLLVVVAYLLFLIRPALLGQLGGTFKGHQVPQEYIKLEKFLSGHHTFSRTFWLPTTQRFGFYSSTHPAIPALDYYHVSSISGVLDNLKKDGAEKQLQEASVKYVIVPFDSEGEIFLTDRKYDQTLYEKTVEEVEKISWLTEVSELGRIHVFAVNNPKDHFWTDSNLKLFYISISPTDYEIKINNVKRGDKLVFSESYDSGWKAEIVNRQQATSNRKQVEIIESTSYEKTLNSFVLPKGGSYTLRVFYQPQEWVNRGVWVSISSIVIISSVVVYLLLKKQLRFKLFVL